MKSEIVRRHTRRGATLLGWMVLAALGVAGGGLLLFQNFIGGRGQLILTSPGERAKINLGRISADLDDMYKLNHAYPPMLPMQVPPGAIASSSPQPATIAPGSRGASAVTTPVGYLAPGAIDPYTLSNGTKGRLFAYWTRGDQYLIYSVGPNRTYDILNPAKFLDAKGQPAHPDWLYDPTNGASSGGDIALWGSPKTKHESTAVSPTQVLTLRGGGTVRIQRLN